MNRNEDGLNYQRGLNALAKYQAVIFQLVM